MTENNGGAAEKVRNRGRGRPFKKGQSGNPGGRPKGDPAVKEMLKAATADAAKLLIDTINNPAAKLEQRIECAKVVMDRVYGKATQQIEGNLDNKIEIVLGGAAKYAR